MLFQLKALLTLICSLCHNVFEVVHVVDHDDFRSLIGLERLCALRCELELFLRIVSFVGSGNLWIIRFSLVIAPRRILERIVIIVLVGKLLIILLFFSADLLL